ncbi:unnamed protein product [Auanema sp. JU1783]|nr:unnamed protein product [Auanema sp. JU1783]
MSDLFNGLANLTKQVTSNISTYEIRKIREKVEGMVLNYTEEETLVREATNEDPWGPTGQQMKDITHLSFQYDGFSKVMPMIWKRMFEDNRQAWRRVYKSLTLLDYLLHNGSERVIGSSRDHIYQLRALESYKFTDEKGRDQGINIRHRCAKILELLNDEDKLRNERKRAKDENKEKYQGYNSDDVRLKAQGMSFGSDSNSSPRRQAYSTNDRDDYSNKEVNSFSFPEDNRQSCEAVEEEDDFESFAQSRSSASPKPPATNKQIAFGIPSPTVSSFKISPVPRESEKTFDLLGFDSNTDTAKPAISSPDKLLDIFNSTGQQSDMQFATIPRPPSNGPGSTPAGNKQLTVTAQEVDLLGGFSLNEPTENNATTGAGFVTSTDSNDWFASSKPANDGFADFSAFQSAGTAASSSLFAHTQETGLAPQPIADSIDFTNAWMSDMDRREENKPDDSNKVLASPGAPKVGNTWTGADSDLFNLDNLGMKTSGNAKTNLSLNEMQKTKKW